MILSATIATNVYHAATLCLVEGKESACIWNYGKCVSIFSPAHTKPTMPDYLPQVQTEIELLERLQLISNEDWQRLLVATKQVELNSEYYSSWFHLVENLGITWNFDWVTWKETAPIVVSPHVDYKNFHVREVCCFISAILREDRFKKGHALSKFNDGTMLSLVKVLVGKYFQW